MKYDKTNKMNQKLGKAIQTGNLLKTKEALMGNICNVNNKDEYGRTVIYDAIVKGNIDIIEELCIAKIDINNMDNNGKTPLHFASIYNRLDIAKILIQYGANVNLRDKNGNTPIFDAIFNCKGNPSIILLLKENNADYTTQNNYGVSPKELSETIANFDVSTFLE
jgi:ankyrin repeat protein